MQGGGIGRVATVAAFVTFLKPGPNFDVAWRREPGGGPVLINAIHESTTCARSWVKSSSCRPSRLPACAASRSRIPRSLRFAGGALGTLTRWDAAAPPWSWELTAGENPAYPRQAADCYPVPNLRLWRYPGEKGGHAPLAVTPLAIAPAAPYERQLRHFCAVIRGSEAPLVTARDAGLSLAATCAIGEAARSGETIKLPRGDA